MTLNKTQTTSNRSPELMEQHLKKVFFRFIYQLKCNEHTAGDLGWGNRAPTSGAKLLIDSFHSPASNTFRNDAQITIEIPN